MPGSITKAQYPDSFPTFAESSLWELTTYVLTSGKSGTSLVRNQQMELQKLTGLYEQIKQIQRLPAGKITG
jgi:hypothetical protein